MDYNREKIEEVVLALLTLTMTGDGVQVRAWKSHDWGVMESLHERGWISDPRSKAKSVVITEEGQAKAREFFEKHFGPGA